MDLMKMTVVFIFFNFDNKAFVTVFDYGSIGKNTTVINWDLSLSGNFSFNISLIEL